MEKRQGRALREAAEVFFRILLKGFDAGAAAEQNTPPFMIHEEFFVNAGARHHRTNGIHGRCFGRRPELPGGQRSGNRCKEDADEKYLKRFH